METGIAAKNNKIPIYASNFKREYLFIRGLNKYFKCFAKKLDLLNHGLFESNTSNTIKKYMKRFLREQEKGKFNDISNFYIPSYAIDIIRDIIFIDEQFELYKIRYDYFCNYSGEYNTGYDSDSDSDSDSDNEYFVDGKPYPGFKEFYDIFKMVFNQIKYAKYNSDSDSDIDFYI